MKSCWVRRAHLISMAALMMVFTTGCGVRLDYNKLHGQIANDNCAGAIGCIENDPKAYGRNQELLFNLDVGMVAYRCDDASKSTYAFTEAGRIEEELWTRSLTKEAGSFLTNDYMLPYRGEDYERAMRHLFSALSYVKQESSDEALVEIRQLGLLLSELNEEYEEKNVYKDDAFGRYLSGLLYMKDRDWSDAYIDLHAAWTLYTEDYARYESGRPESLLQDLALAAVKSGRLDDAESLTGTPRKNLKALVRNADRKARIYLIRTAGVVPAKKEDALIVPSSDGPISIAFPVYGKTPAFDSSAHLLLSGKTDVDTPIVSVEPIHKIAKQNLEDRRARVMAKALIRAAAKQAVIHGVAGGKKNSTTRQWLNMVNTLVLERADTRSWRTLPASIQMASAYVDPGSYTVRVRDANGEATLAREEQLKAATTYFLFADTI